MIYFALTVSIMDFIAIGLIVYYMRKHKRENDESNKRLSENVEEAYKRVSVVSNALPRTPKEGSLGYYVSLD